MGGNRRVLLQDAFFDMGNFQGLCQTRLDIGGISVLQALAACLSCSRLMCHVDTRECPLFVVSNGDGAFKMEDLLRVMEDQQQM